VLDLHQKMLQSQNQGYPTVVSQMASVTGLGGIGKTELCRKYIQEHGDLYDGNIIWFTAETEQSLHESFIRLAKDVLELSTKDANGGEKDITTVVDEVYNYFSGRKSLFVFDNAESNKVLEKFMPIRVQQKPHILITSRDKDWDFEVELVALNELDEQDAIVFVKKGLGLGQDEHQEQDTIKLVTALQRYPLALQQATSFIRQQRMVISYDIPSYLSTLEVNAKILLDSNIAAGPFNSYKNTTFTTWKTTTNRIANIEDHGALAIRVLNIISYMGADNIPTKMLCKLEGEECGHLVLLAIRLLVKYSMADAQPENCTISIHRLVQEVTRVELKNKLKEEETLWDVLNLLYSSCSNHDSTAVDHSIVAWNHAANYPVLIKKYSSLASILTRKLFNLERYKEASSFGTHAFQLLQLHFDSDNVNLLRIEIQISKVLFGQGKYSQCVDNCSRLVTRAKPILGEFHEDILEAKYYLAASLRRLGNYSDSMVLLQNILNQQIKVFGKEDVRTINTIMNLATCHHVLGENQAELELYEDIRKKYSSLLGRKHRSVLSATQNSAVLRGNIGRLDKATDILKEIYKAAQILGEKNTLRLTVGHNLSEFLYHQGKFEEAFEIATYVFDRRKEILGIDHLETLNIWNGLGTLLRCQGKYNEALLIHQNIYRALVKQCGPDHRYSLSAKLGISLVWSEIGMMKEALLAMKEILAAELNSLGSNHFETFNTQLHIAKVLKKMKRSKEALQLFEEMEEKITNKYGDGYYKLPEIRENIAKLKTEI